MDLYNISKYTSDSLPNEEVGKSIVLLLSKEFPEVYSQESKIKSLSKRDTAEKINGRINNGCIYLTIQDTQEQVLGFLEMKLVEVEGGFYIQLCWIVIDSLFQGKGLASKLNKVFEQEAKKIGETLKGNWCLQLGTGKNNSAQEIYKKWGYSVYEETDTDVLMIKDM